MRQVRPAAAQAGSGMLRAAGQQRLQLGLLEPQVELVVVAAGEQQQVVGDPGEPFGFVGRVVHRGGEFLAAAAGPAGELEFPAQHRERGAQLVAGVGDEGALPRSAPAGAG